MPRAKANQITRLCETCGEEFHVSAATRRKPNSGRFCSNPCKYRARTTEIAIRFKRFLGAPNINGCIEWTGSRDANGYGVFFIRKGFGRAMAHRVSWELTNGPIPNGMFICHKCDNPSCVNQEHLFLGTCADNNSDMTNKGRRACGERGGTARLTTDDVLEIRKQHASRSMTTGQLARRYNTNVNTIYFIVSRRSWKHV